MTLAKKIILALLILTAFVLVIFYFSTRGGGKAPIEPTQTGTPTPAETVIPPGVVSVVKIVPDNTLPLTPGQKQTFTLSFSNSVNLDQIEVRLTQTNLAKEAPLPLSLKLSLSQDNKILTVTSGEALLSNNKYELSVIDKATGNAIFRKSFLSGTATPTPAPSNNLSLVPFLPYETSSFRLSYLSSRNIYVFNFKWNPSLPDNFETQYQKAKEEAIKFIESKGINVSTIVIEWRYS